MNTENKKFKIIRKRKEKIDPIDGNKVENIAEENTKINLIKESENNEIKEENDIIKQIEDEKIELNLAMKDISEKEEIEDDISDPCCPKCKSTNITYLDFESQDKREYVENTSSILLTPKLVFIIFFILISLAINWSFIFSEPDAYTWANTTYLVITSIILLPILFYNMANYIYYYVLPKNLTESLEENFFSDSKIYNRKIKKIVCNDCGTPSTIDEKTIKNLLLLSLSATNYNDRYKSEENKQQNIVIFIICIILFVILNVFCFLVISTFNSKFPKTHQTSTIATTSNYNYTNTETPKISTTTPKPNIKYTEVVLDKQVLYKLGYNPADKKNFTSVKIPATYEFKGNHYKITKIGEKSFYNYGALQKVTIEEGVQILGVSAFENCTALTTVNLPNSINKINNNVFANCKALTTINLPDGIKELRDSLFFNCLSLSNIDIPSSVTSIGDMVFYKCKSLEKITIPENVTSIGQSAFAGCRGLENINIPSSCMIINKWAFSNCVSLNKVIIPDEVSSIGEEAFSNVPYVYYDGSASGQPWGALDSNKMPEIDYTLEEVYGNDYLLGEPTEVINQQYLIPYGTNKDNTVNMTIKYYINSIKSIGGYIISSGRNGLKTNKGIQIGDSENKLFEAYGNNLKIFEGTYHYDSTTQREYIYKFEGGYYQYNYTIPKERFPQEVSINFQVKDGKVSKMMISDGGQHAYEIFAKIMETEFRVK